LQKVSSKSKHSFKSGIPLQCGVVVVAVDDTVEVGVDSTEMVSVEETLEVTDVVGVDVAVEMHVLHMAGHSCRR
jgi:hypothetical protein